MLRMGCWCQNPKLPPPRRIEMLLISMKSRHHWDFRVLKHRRPATEPAPGPDLLNTEPSKSSSLHCHVSFLTELASNLQFHTTMFFYQWAETFIPNQCSLTSESRKPRRHQISRRICLWQSLGGWAQSRRSSLDPTLLQCWIEPHNKLLSLPSRCPPGMIGCTPLSPRKMHASRCVSSPLREVRRTLWNQIRQ